MCREPRCAVGCSSGGRHRGLDNDSPAVSPGQQQWPQSLAAINAVIVRISLADSPHKVTRPARLSSGSLEQGGLQVASSARNCPNGHVSQLWTKKHRRVSHLRHISTHNITCKRNRPARRAPAEARMKCSKLKVTPVTPGPRKPLCPPQRSAGRDSAMSLQQYVALAACTRHRYTAQASTASQRYRTNI